jgi:hypothetical protein
MAGAAVLCAARRATLAMVALGDDDYTYTNPRAESKEDEMHRRGRTIVSGSRGRIPARSP